jgi:protein involved in polysaccharide export with SLBB domain
MKKILILTIISTSLVAQMNVSAMQSIANEELDKIRNELQNDLAKSNISINNDPIAQEIVSLVPKEITQRQSLEYFGYEYFAKEINFFDNIPTPANFKLGPGDEITLSFWGDNNSRENFTINKAGMIYYEDLGFINLSNKTIKEAESTLVQELSKIYSTMKNSKSTKLMIELANLRSLNIYFSGEIFNPGINLIHPFSDPFSALVQVGGIKTSGSLRNIEIIRNGTVHETIDFYQFFNKGKDTFSNVKLVDGDIIHVPTVKNRIKIQGAINRAGYYEILPNEYLQDLIKHASGLTAMASSTIVVDTITPMDMRDYDDKAISSTNINLNDDSKFNLNNGDSINIISIKTVESKVEIYGRVKIPGLYSAINQSLRDILDIAGGFNDPIFKESISSDDIIVLRKDSKQFYSQEFQVKYKDSNSFMLEVGDKIFVYGNQNYKNSFTYRVNGEVEKPGTYPLFESKITVREAIRKAGGLTELSSARNITLIQEYTSVDIDGNQITTKEEVNNVNLDFEIGINSVITASPLENVIRVEGNVYNPGLITFTKGYRYPRYIELAGGYKSDTLKNKTYIKRANGNIEKVNGFFISRGKKVYPGDTIVVPANPNPNDFNITTFISDLSATLANIAAILLIVDNQND